MLLQGDVQGETYKKFIQYALQTSDAFMLVTFRYLKPSVFSMKERIAQYKKSFPNIALTEELITHFRQKEDEDRQWQLLLEQKVPSVLGAFSPFLLKQRHNPVWPCTTAFPPPNIQYDINIYRADMAAVPLLCALDNYVGWRHPNFPEDLCFFRNNRCWTLGCSHEEFINVSPKDYREYLALREMGINFFDDFSIDDPKTLFFEDY